MNHLCFMSNLTSAEWAAWVQAIGSVAAIFIAIRIAAVQAQEARLQSSMQHETALHLQKRQHESALELQQRERRHAELGLARTLARLATNCSMVVTHSIKELKDRRTVYLMASGEMHFDKPLLRYLENSISNIPLHALPDTLVGYPMYLAATIRQFREKVELVLDMETQRQMTTEDFDNLHKTFDEVQAGLSETVTTIETQIEKLEISAG